VRELPTGFERVAECVPHVLLELLLRELGLGCKVRLSGNLHTKCLRLSCGLSLAEITKVIVVSGVSQVDDFAGLYFIGQGLLTQLFENELTICSFRFVSQTGISCIESLELLELRFIRRRLLFSRPISDAVLRKIGRVVIENIKFLWLPNRSVLHLLRSKKSIPLSLVVATAHTLQTSVR